MKILVTGGAGFIGSHVAEAVAAEGACVHVLDNFSSGREENVPAGVPVHRLDIRDRQVGALFERERFDVLVHHAAQLDVRRSVHDPVYDADVNVCGLLNLLEVGRVNGLRKVVLASSGGAVYGEPKYLPQDEAHPLDPLSPYGLTKLMAEKYLGFYARAHGISYVVLRYGNVYGPRQNGTGEGGVVAVFIRRLLEGHSIIVNGDGEQTRDFVHVDDVVRINLLALQYNEIGIFNVGSGRESSINQIAERIQMLVDPAIPRRYGPGKPGEQRRSVLSCTHAESALGWRPQIALEDGLHRTVQWFRRRDVSSAA